MDQATRDKLTLLRDKATASITKLEKEHIVEVFPEWKEKIEYLKKVEAKTTELLTKADNPLEGDWIKDYNVIEGMIKDDPYFTLLFKNGEDLLQKDKTIEQAQVNKVAEVKEKANAWYGKNAENPTIPQEKTRLVLATFERAKEIIKKAREDNGAEIGMRFFGCTEPESRKMSKTIDRVVENVDKEMGISMQIEKVQEDDFSLIHEKYGVEHVPTVVFTRNNKEIARHAGELSISALQKKVDMLASGGNFSDSSSVDNLDNQRTVSDREVYSLGEFVVLYFNDHLSHNCGYCKRMDPIYKSAIITHGNKIKMQTFDATSTLQFKVVEKYQITHIPTAIFLYKGKEKGRFVGYIDNTTVEKWVEDFVINERATDLINKKDATSILNRHIRKMDKEQAAEAERLALEEKDNPNE